MWVSSFGRTKIFISILTLLAFSACTKSGTSDANLGINPGDETISIGEVGSMTGAEATFGMSTHKGIALAFKKINLAGGIKGKKLKLISLDDQGKPEEAATAVTRLITQDKVAAVLGEVASSRSMAMAPIAQNHKVPMITPSSTNPKVTELGNYIFRVCFIDPFQGYVMAKFASENLKAKKVAILRDVKNDYSVGLADYFTNTFKKSGGQIVLDQSYSAGDIDFKSQLTAIRAKKPDAIFVPGYYTEVGLIARQARELGLDVPLLGGDGWDSPKLTEIAGTALNGSFFSNHYSSENQAPHIQEFIKEFKDTYGVVPDGLAAAGYDAARVLAQAMNSAKSESSKDIRDAIAQIKGFEGVTGSITIDSKRNAVKSAVVLKVDGTEFKYLTEINPT